MMKPPFLSRLLNGKKILVEYQNASSDIPLFKALPLDGFREKWEEAMAAMG